MSPPSRRRHRALRPGAIVVVALAGAAVLLALVVGGAVQVGSQSAAYWRTVDRSFAAAARPLMTESGTIGAALRVEVPEMPGQSRQVVEAELDTLVRSARTLATQADLIATPSPPGGVGAAVAQVLTARAAAVSDLRSALDRLLQMAPLSVAGATGVRAAAPHGAPRPLSASGARRALGEVGARLAAADGRYARARRVLRADPAHASVPRSAWVGDDPEWGATRVTELVGALLASSTLAAETDVVLVDQALRVTPTPVPPAPGTPAGTAVVPPTDDLALDVVVADDGNTSVFGSPVRATSVPRAGGRRSSDARRVSIGPGGSVSVQLGPLRVRPGRTYQVTVTVAAPAGEVAGAVTSDTFRVEVAPNAPAPS